jgi:hypothetical protein
MIVLMKPYIGEKGILEKECKNIHVTAGFF